MKWIFFSFIFGLFLETFCSIVTFHQNFHIFTGSLFKWLIGVFVHIMVVSIRLRHCKGFIELHSQMTSILTNFDEFVVCLDWVNVSVL